MYLCKMQKLGFIIGRFCAAVVLVFAFSCHNGNANKEKSSARTDSLQYNIPELKFLNKQIETHQNQADLYYQRALIWENLQEWSSAIDDLNRAAGLDTSADYIALRLASIYMSASDKKLKLPDSRKAIETLKEFINHQSDNLKVKKELARIYTYVEQYPDADRLLIDVIKQAPRDAEAYFLRGNNFQLLGDTVQAINAYQTSVEINPENFTAQYELGLLFDGLGKDIALDYFNNALRLDPENEDALYAHALFLQNHGRYKEAIAAYREMVILNPQNDDASYNLGYIYFVLDSLDLAYKNFDRVTKLVPDDADAYYMRGHTEELRGNIDKARIDYIQTLNLKPDHELAREALKRIGK